MDRLAVGSREDQFLVSSFLPFSVKFWSHVDLSNRTGCWSWIGAKCGDGYGRLSLNRKSFQAHRVALALDGYRLTSGLVVDHLCRNRACVRPDHLRETTHKENMTAPGTPAARDSCARGHLFSQENTSIDRRGARTCKICRRLRKRARYIRNFEPAIKKTHCQRGHEFNEENVYTAPDGRRRCKTCSSVRERKYRTQRNQKPPE